MKKKWIINSLLDLDFYKLTMAQIAFCYFKQIPVKFAFINRTKKIKIAKIVNIDKLKIELDHVRVLRFSLKEDNYLFKQKIFKKDFLEFLKNLQLPKYCLFEKDGQFEIEFFGNWPEVTFWETICLSILNELYYQALLKRLNKNEKRDVFEDGRKRLERKIVILKKNPQIVFTEFGTRRRFSRCWQKYVVSRLGQELPKEQFVGTSNVKLAMDLGLKPIGTFAHEMYMVFSGIFRQEKNGILKSHNKVLEYWWDMYGEVGSIALTDTYGSDFFFTDMTINQAKGWRGLRHDSGDPVEFGEKAIRFYQGYGINPREKVIVFSDGLELDKILKIEKHFRNRIKVVFGWGTNLTNDLGLLPISMVIKAVFANGSGTVKLSDNLEKAMGDKNDIALFKDIFHHTIEWREECIY